mmetsp:Transcript_653/g.780  ORF Transcript_653/g.780 Transcript_653/m.780 type:complete len:234 (-) Transcript_653:205-906(-)
MTVDGTEAVVVKHDDPTPKKIALDALPYIDYINEEYEKYAHVLIEEEMKKMKHSHPLVTKSLSLPPLNLSSEILRDAYQNITQKEHINNKNKDVEKLIETNRASEPSQDTIETWKQAVQDAKTEYEAERQRSIVLEIEKSEASANQWKIYCNGLLDTLKENLEDQVEQGRDNVERINAGRQQHQEKIGHSLDILTTKYQGMMRKKFQLQRATLDLQAERDLLNEKISSNDDDS